jgi:hypothetical protein
MMTGETVRAEVVATTVSPTDAVFSVPPAGVKVSVVLPVVFPTQPAAVFTVYTSPEVLAAAVKSTDADDAYPVGGDTMSPPPGALKTTASVAGDTSAVPSFTVIEAAVPGPVAVLHVTVKGVPVITSVCTACIVPVPIIDVASRAANAPAPRRLNTDKSMEDHPLFRFLHDDAGRRPLS